MNAFNTARALPAGDLESRKNQLLRRTRRSGRAESSWRCTACGGRIDIRLKFDVNDKECGSVGVCRTAGCIHWEE